MRKAAPTLLLLVLRQQTDEPTDILWHEKSPGIELTFIGANDPLFTLN